MKKDLRFLLLLVIVVLGNLTKVDAQKMDNIKIKLAYENKPLELLLFDLKIGYRVNFEYEKEDVEGIFISGASGKVDLEEGMHLVLKDTDLNFKLIPPRTVSIFKGVNQIKEEETTYAQEDATAFDINLGGVVKDVNTGETLPFATVSEKGSTNGTTTNVDGYFTLFNVSSDTAILEVQYLGYQTKEYRLTPEKAKENINILLEDFSQQITEVIVVAEKQEQLLKASTGVSKMSISPAALATLPSFGEKDVFRSLQLLPGISGSNESSSGLYVRGGTPDQNLILFDGFTVYHVDHLFGFFSAFNSNAIKDVQLYKGGFGAKYGGRLSSVVELTGKDGNSEEFNMGVGLSLLSANIYAESPLFDGKGSVLIAGRRSFQSSFYSNIFDAFTTANQDNNPVPTGGRGQRFGQQEITPNTYFYDLNAKVTYRPSPKDVIALSFFNGQDNLDNSRNIDQNSFGGFGGRGGNQDITFNRESTDLTNWGNWGSSLKWSRKWNQTFYSNANLSYSNYYSERDRQNSTTITRSDTTETRINGNYENNDLKDVTFKLDNEWKLASNNQLTFGLQSTYNDISYEYTQNDTLSIVSRLNQGYTNSFYVQDRHTFGNSIILTGGLRGTHYSLTNQFFLEPRASVSILLSNQIKLKGAYGQYNQFATRVVREDIQQGSRDFWLLADDDRVPIGFADHFIGGVSYETKKWLFDVEAYYKNLDGLSEYSSRLGTSGRGRDRTLNYQEFFFQGTGIAKGTEFLIQRKTGKLTGWIGYTLGQVKYDFEDFGDEPFFANQDQTHELKLVGNYKMGKWTFGSTFIYATGRPYTAPTGFYEVRYLDGTTADYFEVSSKNGLRLPDYHRFDISATYDFRIGSSKASLGISVFNVYNRKNVWYKEYEVIEGELFETDVTLLNFTPSLFFSWSLR